MRIKLAKTDKTVIKAFVFLKATMQDKATKSTFCNNKLSLIVSFGCTSY